MADVEVRVREDGRDWIADVVVRDRATTRHRVRVSPDERARYGGASVEDLVRRSLLFLLERESNSSILGEFSLSTIERYFPEYALEIVRG